MKKECPRLNFLYVQVRIEKMHLISFLDGLVSLIDQQTSQYSLKFLRVIRRWGLVDMWHEPDFLSMSLGTRGLYHYRRGGGIQVFLIAGGHCWSHITPKIPGDRALPGKSDYSSRGSRLIPLFSEPFLTAHPSPSSSWPSIWICKYSPSHT